MSNSLQWLTTFYGALIRLYPRQFKSEFADELLSVFIALMQDAASAGFLALTVFCLRELRDFPVNLFRAHLEDNLMSKIFDSDSWRFMLRGVFAFVVLLVVYNVVFYLMMINNSGAFFLHSAFFLDYYQELILILAWAIASATAGTIFAIILGERPRIRWALTLVIALLIPWVVPAMIFGVNNPALTDSAEIRAASMLLLGLVVGLLLFMLLREQSRFRWLVVATMTVWLPQVLTSDAFHLTPMTGMSDLQMELQRIVLNAALGACLAGAFGMLLQNWRKLVLLMVAGGLLYMLVDYVFYQQIYFRVMPILFPMIDFATMQMTNEQFALLSAATAAVTGLLFALPLAPIFIWLRSLKFPATLQPSAQ